MNDDLHSIPCDSLRHSATWGPAGLGFGYIITRARRLVQRATSFARILRAKSDLQGLEEGPWHGDE
jgi:hypothetical protein